MGRGSLLEHTRHSSSTSMRCVFGRFANESFMCAASVDCEPAATAVEVDVVADPEAAAAAEVAADLCACALAAEPNLLASFFVSTVDALVMGGSATDET